MKKRCVSILLALALGLFMAGCGRMQTGNDDDSLPAETLEEAFQ